MLLLWVNKTCYWQAVDRHYVWKREDIEQNKFGSTGSGKDADMIYNIVYAEI